MSFFDQIKSTIKSIPTPVGWVSAGVAGTLVLCGGASLVRAAYVHEMTCREYESDIVVIFNETEAKAERAVRLAERVERNPWAAFNVMGEMIEIASDVEVLSVQAEELREDYVEACGVERVDRFLGSDDISRRIEDLQDVGTQLQNM